MKSCAQCGKQWFNDVKFCPIDGRALDDLVSIDPLDALIGQIINHTYKIEAKIGQGSVGSVFKAKHLGIGDTVAIKVIAQKAADNEKSDLMMRFRREAQAARRLAHPNAVTVYDFNINTDGLLFMVMEYVDGETLEQYLQANAPLQPKRILQILTPITEVVDVAHNLGIIHRDLKPANMMLFRNHNGEEQIKVLDFGTARLLLNLDEQQEAVIHTKQGQVFGTPAYTSPEQAMGEAVGPTTDIYTLGIILYQMLTGTVPFSAQKNYQIIFAHINDAPQPPSERNPNLSTDYDKVVLKALAKKPYERYQTATELIADLTAIINALVSCDTQTLPVIDMPEDQEESDEANKNIEEQPSAAVPIVRVPPVSATTILPTTPTLVPAAPEDTSEPVGETEIETEADKATKYIGNIANLIPKVAEEIAPKVEEVAPKAEEVASKAEEVVPATPKDYRLVLDDNETTNLQPYNFQQYIGGQNELQILRVEYVSSLEDKGQPTFIIGPAGVGKTALITEFSRWVIKQDGRVLKGRFYNGVAGIFEPLYLFKKLAGLLYSSGRLEMIRNVDSGALETTQPQFTISRNPVENDKWKLFERLNQAFTDLAKTTNIVLVLEDLQWADSLSLEYLGYLLRNIDLAHICFVGTARSPEGDHYSDFYKWFTLQESYFYYQKIEIAPLSLQGLKELLQSIFASINIEEQDIEKLYHLSQGNPLYVVELLNFMMETGKIKLKNSIWQIPSIKVSSFPDDLSTLIQERMLKCSDKLAEILRISAAIGDEFQFELLEKILNTNRIDLESILADGVKRLLIRKEKTLQETTFRFYHNSIRQAIYNSIPLEQRNAIHNRIVSALNSLRNTKKIVVKGEFAYHNYLAHSWERAFQHCVAAAEYAGQNLMPDDVFRFVGYAKEAFSHLTVPNLEVQTNLARVELLYTQSLLRLDRLPEAEQYALKLQPTLIELNNVEFLARHYLNLSSIFNRTGQYAKGIEASATGLQLTTEFNNEEIISQLLYNIASCHAHISPTNVAITFFEDLYKFVENNDFMLQSATLSSLGFLYHFAGQWRQGRNYLAQALQTARQCKDFQRECLALIFQCWVYEYEGKFVELHNHYQEALKLARSHGWRNYEAYLHFIAGRHQIRRPDPDFEIAEELLFQSLAIMEELGENIGQAIVSPAIALSAACNNLDDTTIGVLQIACANLATWDDKINYCEALGTLAQMQQQYNLLDEAITTYQQVLELAQLIPYLDAQWRAHFGLGTCLNHKGYAELSADHISQAVAIINQLQKELDTPEEIESFMEDKQFIIEIYEQLRKTV